MIGTPPCYWSVDRRFVRTAIVQESPLGRRVHAAAQDAPQSEAPTVENVPKHRAEDVRRSAGFDQQRSLDGSSDPGDSGPVHVNRGPLMPSDRVLPMYREYVRLHDQWAPVHACHADGWRSAAPKGTLKRSHQTTTLAKAALSTSPGRV